MQPTLHSKLLFTSRPLNIRLLHTRVSFFNWHFVLYSCECCGHVKLTRPSTLSRPHMFESMRFTRREQSYNCVIFRYETTYSNIFGGSFMNLKVLRDVS